MVLKGGVITSFRTTVRDKALNNLNAAGALAAAVKKEGDAPSIRDEVYASQS